MQHRFTWIAALATAMSLPAQASWPLASDKGCTNCHGAFRRGDAPSFERLSAKLAQFKGDPGAEQRFVAEYQAGEMFNHVDAHERLSAESAKALIHWLVEGAK